MIICIKKRSMADPIDIRLSMFWLHLEDIAIAEAPQVFDASSRLIQEEPSFKIVFKKALIERLSKASAKNVEVTV